MKVSWDIFCSVVDNYGDIGVTWRLARQLVAEHQVAVRLWVDDLRAFVPLCPEADASAAQQWQQGVEVRQWPAEWVPVEVADVVIEAFACKLPEAYLHAMKAREKPALWINLEYLSAEEWVSGCHGLPSMRPDGLKRMFFFPGFDAGLFLCLPMKTKAWPVGSMQWPAAICPLTCWCHKGVLWVTCCVGWVWSVWHWGLLSSGVR